MHSPSLAELVASGGSVQIVDEDAENEGEGEGQEEEGQGQGAAATAAKGSAASPMFSFTLRTRIGALSVFRGPWAIFEAKELSPLNKAQIERMLTLRPFSIVGGVKRPQKPIACFRRAAELMMVPRAFFIERFGQPRLDETSRGEPLLPTVAFQGTLRDERQKRFVRNMLACLVDDKKMIALGSAEPGCGKTVMFLFMWSQVIRRKCLIVVHGLAIVAQWIAAVRKFVPAARIGIIHQNSWQIRNRDIVIASSDTLSSRSGTYTSDLWREFGIICFDEAHHIMASTFVSIYMNVMHARYCVSLTGTPYRKDGLTHAMPYFTGPNAAHMKNTDPVQIRIVNFQGGLRSQTTHKYGPAKGKPNESAMISAFVEDEVRTKLIARILRKCILAGRKVLVLCARNDLRKAIKHLVEESMQGQAAPQHTAHTLVAKKSKKSQALALLNLYDAIHIEAFRKEAVVERLKQTRREMVEKLKALEDKLDPETLDGLRSGIGCHPQVVPEVEPGEVAPVPWVEELVAGDDHVTRLNKYAARSIIATYVMAREALDVPGLDTLIFATPSGDVRQAVGRIRRGRAAGSTTSAAEDAKPILQSNKALVVDIVDTYKPFSNWSIVRKQYYRAEHFHVSEVDVTMDTEEWDRQ
jgi:hypothetical protein